MRARRAAAHGRARRPPRLIVGGDLAVELEAGGVPAFRAYAEEFLTETYDATVAAAIDRLIVHSWGTDEWTMGGRLIRGAQLSARRLHDRTASAVEIAKTNV